MDGGTVGRKAGNRTDVRPYRHERCAECGAAVGDEWVSYRQGPSDRETLSRHFGGIIGTGPIEPPPERPKRTIREFRGAEDLGVYFHPWCAPEARVPEQVQEELIEFLAQALVADYKRRVARWAVWRPVGRTGRDPLRCQAHVRSVERRRVVTMTRAEWERFRGLEGELVELDLERTPSESIGAVASAIAGLAAQSPVQTERIEVWRYDPRDKPTPCNVQEYLTLENLTRRLNVPMFAERVSSQDSPTLRKYLREHVFIVKAQPDEGRREAKARAVEQIVFLRTGADRGDPRFGRL